MRIVFKVFPQASHYGSTYALAEALAKRGHEVAYTGTVAMSRHAKSRGFEFVTEADDIFPDQRTAKEIQCTASPIEVAKRMWAMRKLKRMLLTADPISAVAKRARADLLLIDSPYTIFTMPLWKRGDKFVIFQSMPNMNEGKYCPPLDTTYVPSRTPWGAVWTQAHWCRYYAKRYLRGKLADRIDYDKSFVLRLASANGIDKGDLNFRRYFHLGIRCVPEIILAPRALDFPREPATNQIYCNIASTVAQDETVVDYRFEVIFQRFLREKQEGKPLVYCSLGTAGWRYAGAQEFLARVVAASRDEPWNLILATGLHGGIAKPRSSENVGVFQVVPQLRILAESNLMITHGGINSLRECAERGVRMIVCPGTKELDQAGNAARAVHHGLGVTCRLDVSKISLREVIGESLRCPGTKVDCITPYSGDNAADALLNFVEAFVPVRRLEPMPRDGAARAPATTPTIP